MTICQKLSLLFSGPTLILGSRVRLAIKLSLFYIQLLRSYRTISHTNYCNLALNPVGYYKNRKYGLKFAWPLIYMHAYAVRSIYIIAQSNIQFSLLPFTEEPNIALLHAFTYIARLSKHIIYSLCFDTQA